MDLKHAVSDFWHFLVHYKAWWITPIVVILSLLAFLAYTTDDPSVVPFIYVD